VGPALGTAFGADLSDGFVNDALQFFGVEVGVAGADVLDGAMKDPPADGLLR
jgi:hypothetical protein